MSGDKAVIAEALRILGANPMLAGADFTPSDPGEKLIAALQFLNSLNTQTPGVIKQLQDENRMMRAELKKLDGRTYADEGTMVDVMADREKKRRDAIAKEERGLFDAELAEEEAAEAEERAQKRARVA
jgi:hypothetical protein